MAGGCGGPSGFGVRLRSARIAAGMTQEMLAERSGISVDAISALESGRRRRPHARTVTMLADGLGLDVEEREGLAAAARQERRPAAPPPPGRPGAPRISRRTALAIAAAGLGAITLSATEWFARTPPQDPLLEAELTAVEAAAYVLLTDPGSGVLRRQPTDGSFTMAAQRLDADQQYRIVLHAHDLSGTGASIESPALLVHDVQAVPDPLWVWETRPPTPGWSLPLTRVGSTTSVVNAYSAVYDGQKPDTVISAGYDSPVSQARLQIQPRATDELTVRVLSTSPVHLSFQVRLQYRAADGGLFMSLTLPYTFHVVFSDGRNWHT
jgi:transcriptional regulator with XRE-family HTH domain